MNSRKIQVVITERISEKLDNLQEKSDLSISEIVRMALLEYLGVIKKSEK